MNVIRVLLLGLLVALFGQLAYQALHRHPTPHAQAMWAFNPMVSTPELDHFGGYESAFWSAPRNWTISEVMNRPSGGS